MKPRNQPIIATRSGISGRVNSPVSQALSGALFLAFADAIFSVGLKSFVPEDSPNIDPEVIIVVGTAGPRDVVHSQDLPGVLKAYAKSVDHVYYMAAALGTV
ncbi:hypothetical protein BDV10DRAFT_189346 [Aspergillus recurvatus]